MNSITSLNNLHPNELFRFMHVRGPQRVKQARIRRYFVTNVYDQISRSDLAAVQKKITTLYPALITRIGKPKQLSKQMADVAAFQKSKAYITDPDDYASRYPELTSFLNWLDAHLSATTIEAVRNK